MKIQKTSWYEHNQKIIIILNSFFFKRQKISKWIGWKVSKISNDTLSSAPKHKKKKKKKTKKNKKKTEKKPYGLHKLEKANFLCALTETPVITIFDVKCHLNRCRAKIREQTSFAFILYGIWHTDVT